ncbi:uncharacterized membrane protein [[Candida] jaroonii]|uniref:Uncharacterized membrane protein n=1 Tax=[Candida] jaroonii TaxID=467808 RepID=A0ACA9Y6X0_9ASCO|nr:uncharacterized membrane protein [[Candida] jaroonii]
MSSIPSYMTTIYLNRSPEGEVKTDFGLPDSTFKVIKETVRELKDGELLVKNLYLANDADQRIYIRKDISTGAFEEDHVKENHPMICHAVAKVLKSKDSKVKVGELIACTSHWGDYAIIPGKNVETGVIGALGLPITSYVDTIGGTGLYAYFSIFNAFKLKKEHVLVVGGAAGATGSIIVQLAKNVIGAKKVIGIAGGKSKCDFVKSLGADACIDYKDPNFAEKMKRALGRDGECDVYFDGIGGKILEEMFLLTKKNGTIIAGGSVSGYNDADKAKINNWDLITSRSLHIRGFVLDDYIKGAVKAVLWISWWVKRGKINPKLIDLVDLTRDNQAIERIPAIWNRLFTGQKKGGKLITKLADS